MNKPVTKVEGIRVLGSRNGAVVVAVGSGTYEFASMKYIPSWNKVAAR
jgi:hypothetical protein